MTRAPDDHPFVSVIVPVRDGEFTIDDCLEAILATDYPDARREILAVDNGSTDGTAALIQSRPVRYLREERRGVSNARNRGIAESRGEILAFVDADCIVEPQWLTELVRPFEDPEVGGVAGDLKHIPPETPAERQAVRLLGNWQRFAFSSEPPYAVTANAAYRREVLARIGPFGPDMTRAQDVELGLRFQELSDRRLAFAERATARHRNRATQIGFFRQQLGWAYGAGLLGAKFEALGGDPVAPPAVREIGRTARGLGIVAVARVRGRGPTQWVEDAWYDLLRQIAWWVGGRAGLRRGARIWRPSTPAAEPGRSA
ncbi:MAG TPA: glycosyltransferase [Solirubrobacterales bacterium]|nr:glycosyltransferase [Solirubrobacterales bacterium]